VTPKNYTPSSGIRFQFAAGGVDIRGVAAPWFLRPGSRVFDCSSSTSSGRFGGNKLVTNICCCGWVRRAREMSDGIMRLWCYLPGGSLWHSRRTKQRWRINRGFR